MAHIFGIVSKKAKTLSKCSPVLSFKSFIAFHLKFRSMIHFELIFIYFPVLIQLFQHHLLKR